MVARVSELGLSEWDREVVWGGRGGGVGGLGGGQVEFLAFDISI